MAFYETKSRYHRYNFYQIKKTYDNGDDVRIIIPKNPPEAAIISNMLGGSSGGTNSGVPINEANNPDLKGLYYGLVTTNGFTKFVFNFKKFADYLETYGLLNKISLDDNVPTGSKIVETRLIGFVNSWYAVFQIGSDSISVQFDEGKYNTTLDYDQLGVSAESLTYRTLFNLIGSVEVSLMDDDGKTFSDIVTMIFEAYLGEQNYFVNLNEYPIDYMWFE